VLAINVQFAVVKVCMGFSYMTHRAVHNMNIHATTSNFRPEEVSELSSVRPMTVHSQDVYSGRYRGIFEVTYKIILPKYSIQDP
jgi:hypothetical protein